MNLVYYYPMGEGSPSNVARRILLELVEHIDSLPFDEIILFSKPKYVGFIKERFKNLRVIDYKELNNISGDFLVHFPLLPTILPNSKFLLYIFSKFLKKKRIIIQYHGDIRTEFKAGYKKDIRQLVHILSYILLPSLLKSADKVITHSYYMNEIIKKYGVTKGVVIPNAVDSYWFQQNDEAINLKNAISKDGFNIFYHGRLSWEKGVDILIEAVGHLKDNSKIMLYIAGEGPQKKYLIKLSSKWNIDKNVIFLGNISKEEIMFFLRNVDAAIYPSRFDNFPLAVLEALACANCPVYFSEKIGIFDFVLQDQAQLKTFDPNIINLIRLINSAYLGIDRRKTIDQQMEFAKNYTWSKVILKYIKFYNDVIDLT